MIYRAPAAPRIALLVDNPYRDLPGLVLAAWRLCQDGATCYLVPMNLRDREVWPLAPDFALLNHFRTIYESLVQNMMVAGILVGVLDTEGSVFSPMPTAANALLSHFNQDEKESVPAMHQHALSMVDDAGLRHKIAVYCAWTPAFAKYASQAGWYRSEQIAVTGTPRMDFYAPQWHEAVRRMSSFIDTYAEPIILINSSFALANPRFQSPEKEMEMMVNTFSYDRDFMEKWHNTQDQAMKGLASLTNRLAERFPGATFIYRPHPFEGKEAYKELLEPLPNLHLVKRGTVDGWLLRARALIHLGSTTAIDACLAGVPAFTAGWLPVHLPVPAVDDVSIKCSTEDDLVECIAEVLGGTFQPPSEITRNIDQVVGKTFYRIDGLAHQRVADATLNALNATEPNLSIDKCRDFAYGLNRSGSSLKSIVAARLRETLGLPASWSFRRWANLTEDLSWWDRSDKYFDADQIRTLVTAIQACAQEGSKEPLRKVGVQSAQERGDYRFGYLQGRSVTVFPE
ncbi:MAG: surface carbohydrate biosynthesis protein [Chloroflexota bacterium]|nr:surface carbohydrate biosynthesis protein [Chloroflexota bacterium]